MFRRLIASLVCLTFVLSNLQYVHAADFNVNQLPAAGKMVMPSASFVPVSLRAIKIRPDQPLVFDFIVDSGNAKLPGQELKTETEKLAKYFLASLTTPEKDLWVNLSPYEKGRITAPEFGLTEMGRDLLAQDYMLKQFTASLIYPESGLGKEFWSRVYAKAQEQLGTTSLPVNTFNKVWILPDRAVVYEVNNTAIVGESHLRVMMEEDYMALEKNLGRAASGITQVTPQEMTNTSRTSGQALKDLVLPEIEKEVNTGKNFAQLRQVYNALILATWYKENLKDSLLGQVYDNQKKVSGVVSADRNAREEIYQRYISAYKKGVFSYIKEDVDPQTAEVLPRKYFSGGWDGTALKVDTRKVASIGDIPSAAQIAVGDLSEATIALAKPVNAAMTAGEIDQKLVQAEALKSSGDKWGAYQTYHGIISFLNEARKKGEPVDEQLSALRVKALAIMEEMLRSLDLKKYASQRKFALYSGPPAGGKGDVWGAFKKRYSDIIDSFKLFHTRGIRSGESQGNPYHFRTDEHLLTLQEQGDILTTLVNNQLQGLALNAIENDIWKFGKDEGVANVEGLTNIFTGDKVRVLEGGFGWFLTLMAKGGYDEIATIFISPFTEQQIIEFEGQGAKYKAMFEKAQELYGQELAKSKLMSQKEFEAITAQAGDESAQNPFSVTNVVVKGFKQGANQQDWPNFKIQAAGSADLKTGLQITVPADGLFYAAAYETAKRLHKRQWKAVMANDGDFNGKTPKDLGFADAKNYLDRSYEAAVQVHTRGLYGVTLINGFKNTDEEIKQQISQLTDEFAYTIFDALLQDVAAAKAKETSLKNGGENPTGGPRDADFAMRANKTELISYKELKADQKRLISFNGTAQELRDLQSKIEKNLRALNILEDNMQLILKDSFISDLRDRVISFKKSSDVDESEARNIADNLLFGNETLARALAVEIEKRLVFRDGLFLFIRPTSGEVKKKYPAETDRYNRVIEGVAQLLTSSEYGNESIFVNTWSNSASEFKAIQQSGKNKFAQLFFGRLLAEAKERLKSKNLSTVKNAKLRAVLKKIANMGDVEKIPADVLVSEYLRPLINNGGLEASVLGADFQEKFFLYSAPPGAGKGTIMKVTFEGEENKKGQYENAPYEDIVKKYVLIHSRKPRPGEVNGVAYHFWSPEKIEKMASESNPKIAKVLVNGSLQAIVLHTFSEVINIDLSNPSEKLLSPEIDRKISQTGNVVTVERTYKGILDVFKEDSLYFLEGGYAWYQYLKQEFPNISQGFISPFSEQEMKNRTAVQAWLEQSFRGQPESIRKMYEILDGMETPLEVILKFFNYNPRLFMQQMEQWRDEFKTKLGVDVTVEQMLMADPKKDSRFEFFQLLDDKGNLLNQIKPRALVHYDGDWHRDVRILVVDPTGENVFIQKRGESKDMEPGLLADSIGGHTRIGESYDQNATREAFEELGIEVNPVQLERLGGKDARQRDDINNGAVGPKRQINRSHYAAYVYRLTKEEFEQLKKRKPDYDDGITPGGVITKRFFESSGFDVNAVIGKLEKEGIIKEDPDNYDKDKKPVKTGYAQQWLLTAPLEQLEGRIKDLFSAKDAETIILIFRLGTGWLPIEDLKKVGQEHPAWVVDSLKAGFKKGKIYDQYFNGASASASPANPAQVADPLGGINLDPALLNMKVERTGNRIKVVVDPAVMRRMRFEGVDGFRPIVIDIVPVKGFFPELSLSNAPGNMN